MESFEACAPLVSSYFPFISLSESKGKPLLYNNKSKQCHLSHSGDTGKHISLPIVSGNSSTKKIKIHVSLIKYYRLFCNKLRHTTEQGNLHYRSKSLMGINLA